MFRHGEAAVEKFRTASPTVGLLSATRATEIAYVTGTQSGGIEAQPWKHFNP